MNFQTAQGQIAEEVIAAHKKPEVQHRITEMPPGNLLPAYYRDLNIQFSAQTWSEPRTLPIHFADIYPPDDNPDRPALDRLSLSEHLDRKKLTAIITQWLEEQQISS